MVLLSHKNRAVNSNAFHDNQHMCIGLSWIITQVRLSILLVAETTFSNSLIIHEENSKEINI